VSLRAASAVAALSAVLAAAAPSRAQTDEDAARARSLFDQAVELSDRGQYEAAIELFRQSLDLVERPSTVYNLGVALREIHRDVEALEAFERFLQIADDSIDRERRQEARRFIDRMGPQDGTFVLQLVPADARVSIDDAPASTGSSPLEVTLAPGTHHVEISASGRTESFDVEIAPGEHIERRVELASPSAAGGAPGRSTEEVVGWTSIGLATSGLVGSLVLTGLREDRAQRYDGYDCAPSTWGLRRDACPQLRSEIDVTTVMMVVGWAATGTFAGVGAILLLVAPPSAAQARACGPGPGEIGVACSARF
jgi:hypothetical protein